MEYNVIILLKHTNTTGHHVRVQLPLGDVPLDLGPIQIKPEINAAKCPIIKGKR